MKVGNEQSATGQRSSSGRQSPAVEVARMRIQGTYGTMYYVSHMEEACDFFQSHFNMEPVFRSEEWTEFNLTNHRLCLHFLANGETHPRTGILILQVNGLREMVDEMQSNGVRFHSHIREVVSKGLSCDIFDPDGNIISLFEKNP